jgi:glycosyltransferase involved in cell wall biosynthesis
LALQKRVLMIAFHFPPQRGSSGLQRTLRFARYLPEFGWEPLVLSAHPRAYDSIDNTDDPPAGLFVHRAFALDASRHLAIGRRYPSILARPDRWASWWWGAVPAGLRLIHRLRPQVLWSTYPIATAHLIGHTLARISGLPWIADFRDPMAQDGYPADPAIWRSFKRIETRTIELARRSVFTAPSAVRQYEERYPAHAERMSIIENGFDEESFAHLGETGRRAIGRPIVLLHSGIVYPSERDPTALFSALGHLRRQGRIPPGTVVVRFRAPVHDAMLNDLAMRHGVNDVVEVVPPLPYREALAEMLAADGLLVLQAANCNEQIPAKLYEYLRAGRPILGLTDPDGDTAKTLRAAGITHIAALEDGATIADMLGRFIDDLHTGTAPLPDSANVRRASRRERTALLAHALDAVHEHAQ